MGDGTFYRRLFDDIPIGLYRTTPEGEILEANPALVAMLGFRDLSALRKVNVRSLYVDPHDRERLVERLRQDGVVYHFETRLRRADARTLEVELYARALYDEQGKIRYLAGSVQDASWSKRAEERLKRREAVLACVGYAAERLLTELDWQSCIQDILQRLGQAAGADRAYLCEMCSDSGAKSFPGRRHEWLAPGIDGQLEGVGLQVCSFEAEGFERWAEVLGSGEPLHGSVGDFSESERDLLQARGIRSLVVVPIMVSGSWWGWMGLDSCRDDREWEQAEIDALRIAANILSAAVERQRAEEERERLLRAEHEQRLQAETLREVTLALAAQQDLPELMEEILRRAARLVPYDAANISLLEGENLRVVHWRGYDVLGGAELVEGLVQPLVKLPYDAQALEGRKAILVSDTHQDHQWVIHEETSWVRSNVVVPILLGERPLGLLRFDSATPGYFTAQDAERLVPLARAAALALENAHLLSEAQARAAELSSLLDATRAVSSALELETVLQTIARRVLDLAGADGCTLSRWEREAGTLVTWIDRFADNRSDPDPPGTSYSLADFPATRAVLEGRRPLMVCAQDPDADPAEVRLMKKLGQRVLLMLPLVAHDQVIGLLEVDRTRSDIPFSEQDIRICQGFADQAAVAIEHARLFGQLQTQTEQLEQVLASVPEGMILLDHTHRVLMVNPLGREYLDLLAGEGWQERLSRLGDRPIESCLTERRAGDWSDVVSPGPPQRIFEVEARPVRVDGREPQWVLLVREITQARAIQQRLALQDRLASVGQLAAGIAHDFNNIMATITLFGEMLQKEEGISNRGQERLSIIMQQAQRAATLTKQILDFSRQSAMEPRPLDLLTFLLELEGLLARVLPENIHLKLEYEDGDYALSADPGGLQQVFMNLALNARDAMPGGGELRILLDRLTAHKGGLRIFATYPLVSGCGCAWWIMGRVLRLNTCRASSNLSSPPKASGRGRGWGWRRSLASSSSIVAISMWRAHRGRARLSPSICRPREPGAPSSPWISGARWIWRMGAAKRSCWWRTTLQLGKRSGRFSPC